jgi:hypothetical protein
VVAGAALASVFSAVPLPERPTYVVFYGCAGSIDKQYVGDVFLVGSVSYASLGEVVRSGNAESVRLKNKWICAIPEHSRPTSPEPGPLPRFGFSTVLGDAALDLRGATDLAEAHVVATDKVVKLAAAAAPPARMPSSGGNVELYAKAEWEYSQVLAFEKSKSSIPVLVEMESYGIATTARALGIEKSVVVLRVVTDALEDHSEPGGEERQVALLLEGRTALLRLLLAVIVP